MTLHVKPWLPAVTFVLTLAGLVAYAYRVGRPRKP